MIAFLFFGWGWFDRIEIVMLLYFLAFETDYIKQHILYLKDLSIRIFSKRNLIKFLHIEMR